MLRRSNVLDKAQIEKSVLYPAFLFGEADYGEESVMGLLMEKRKAVRPAKQTNGSIILI